MSDQQTIIETVSAFAVKKSAPFTSREVFDNCDTCDDIQPVYAAVNQLFTRGKLKRRKLPGKPGYEFVWHQVDIAGFDDVALSDSTASLLGATSPPPQAEAKREKPKADKPNPEKAEDIPQFVVPAIGTVSEDKPTPTAPSWWIHRDGGLRIETGDRMIAMDLSCQDANDLANMIIGVHEVLGVQ